MHIRTKPGKLVVVYI